MIIDSARRDVAQPIESGTLGEVDRLGAALAGDAGRVKIAWLGVRSDPRIEPGRRMAGVSNYFLGSDPKDWLRGVPHFESVRLSDLYPGISVEVTRRAGGAALRFDVDAGADLDRIQLAIDGADPGDISVEAVSSGESSTLLGATSTKDVALVPVMARIVPTAEGGFGIAVAGHDPRRPSALSVTLEFTASIGGSSGPDFGTDIAVDESGSAYVSGVTFALDYPITFQFGEIQPFAGTTFVTKLSPDGRSIVYSSLIARSSPTAIVVDSNGSVLMAGSAASEFPTTPGAYQSSPGGQGDAFITKLSPDGGTLVYSSLFGGDDNEYARDLAIDAEGAPVIVGTRVVSTSTGDEPPPTSDIFVARLSVDGASLTLSREFGGGDDDVATGVAVDSSGSLFITGVTFSGSPSFPTTATAFDTVLDGASDAFLLKLSADGSQLVYSTLLGGGGFEVATGLAVDDDGQAFVVGTTAPSFGLPFPTTPGAFRTDPVGSEDVFVAKVDATGQALVFATLLGGSGFDIPSRIALAGGEAVVIGDTGESFEQFPTTPGAFDETFNGGSDLFVTRLDVDGSSLVFSTLIGGPLTERAGGLAIDGAGSVYLTGTAANPGFPVTHALPEVGPDTSDAIAVKLSPDGRALEYSCRLGGSVGTDRVGDTVRDVTTDASGAIFLVGDTRSANYPSTAEAASPHHSGGTDVVVTKIAPDGASILYSTFLGGDGNDVGSSIAVGPDGDVFITGSAGEARGTPFPTTEAAFDRTHALNADAFVVRLAADGDRLMYSTFLGGDGTDSGVGIAVDRDGRAFIAGFASLLFGEQFPTTANAFDTTPGGTDAFVTCLEPDGSSLRFSTFLGGDGSDGATGIALDGAGAVFVTGITHQPILEPFPTTPNAFDRSVDGFNETFVVRFTADGASLVYATLLGGSERDDATDIAVDSAGECVVTGGTFSLDFPTTPGSLPRRGSSSAFVSRVSPDGSQLVSSTCVDGSAGDHAFALDLDADGTAWITGVTSSTDFPVTENACRTEFETSEFPPFLPQQNAFVSAVSRDARQLIYSSYLAWGGATAGTGLTVLEDGGLVVVGTSKLPVDAPREFGVDDGSGAFVLRLAPGAHVRDFAIAASQESVRLAPGQTGSITIHILRDACFDGRVKISAPSTAGLKVKFDRRKIASTGASVTFGIKVKRRAIPGSYTLVFESRDKSGRVRDASVALEIAE